MSRRKAAGAARVGGNGSGLLGSAAEFFAATRPPTREVTLKDGRRLRLRRPGAAALVRIQKLLQEGPLPEIEQACWAIRFAAVDGDGQLLFGDEDVAQLLSLDGDDLQPLVDAISELAGPEALEELAGNSAGGPVGDSPSVSPSPSATPTRTS